MNQRGGYPIKIAHCWLAALAFGGALLSSSAGADEERPSPLQAGSLAVSHKLPRRVICRTGPGLQLSIAGKALTLTGFITEKNITAKSYTELKPGSCAGMVHPDNNVGTAAAPDYMKFGPQSNGPGLVQLGVPHEIFFEIAGGRLTTLKAVPSQAGQDTHDIADITLDAVRSWAQARDGEIEFTAEHAPQGGNFGAFRIPVSSGAIAVRSLTK